MTPPPVIAGLSTMLGFMSFAGPAGKAGSMPLKAAPDHAHVLGVFFELTGLASA
jgi:hypothetical protein